MFDDENQAVEATGRALMDHRPPTVSEKLEQEKKELELRLEAVTDLIASLDASPNVRDIVDRLSQLGHRVY
jgi:predicted component of type VI protein secretion system